MAATTIFGSPSPAAALNPYVYHSVWVRRVWTDAWEYVPYVRAERAKNCLWPDMPEAKLVYDFGFIKRHDLAVGDIWAPYDLSGAYIRIEGHSEYGSEPLFYGVCAEERYKMHTRPGILQGQELPTVYGMEHVLERQIVSYTEAQSAALAAIDIDRPMVFNKQGRFGGAGFGNRSSAEYGDTFTSHVFGDSVTPGVWSNLDILAYLLKNFAPVPGPTWIVTAAGGEATMLDGIKQEHDLEGLDLFKALNQLIDRHRGLSARTFVDESDNVQIMLFSMLDVNLSNDVFANPFSARLALDSDPSLEADLHVDASTLHSSVLVKGGPVRVCGTWSYENAELEQGWPVATEAEYRAVSLGSAVANDGARSADKYEHVYVRHRVPNDWDGLLGENDENAAPEVQASGLIDATVQAPYMLDYKTFDDEIPFAQPRTSEGTLEYRKMFAFATDPDSETVVLVDRMDAVDKDAATLQPSRRELSVFVRTAGANHRAGLNHFNTGADGATGKDPEWDYETLKLTAMYATDRHLKVLVAIDDANALTEYPKQKVIFVPDAEIWYVVPGTVTDVVDGAELVQAAASTPRDDSARVRRIALMAYAWYLNRRHALDFKINTIDVAFGPGTLIEALTTLWQVIPVGTVVSSIAWDFPNQTTRYTTSHANLQFAEMAPGSVD